MHKVTSLVLAPLDMGFTDFPRKFKIPNEGEDDKTTWSFKMRTLNPIIYDVSSGRQSTI